jgi:phytoene dehydrogenase-like protein
MKGARSHYDVLVLGAAIPALAAGALLARRGFRVAWVRHDALPNTYQWDELALRRAPESASFVDSPAWKQIASDLSLPALAPRRAAADAVLAQLVLPRHRVDLRSDRDALLAEFEREFPELRRPTEDLFGRVSSVSQELDRALAEDAPWPPDGFFARRALKKALAKAPSWPSLLDADLLADFPEGHDFRTAFHALARFWPDTDPDAMFAAQLARSWSVALSGMPVLDGGRDGLARLLGERIAQFGGDVRDRERVRELVVERGRVVGVRFDVTDEALGCAHCITSMSAASALALARIEAPPAFLDQLSLAEPVYSRYALNVVVGAGGVPPGLASRAYVVLDTRRPMSEENLLLIEQSLPDPLGRTVLTAHALLPRAVVDEGAPYLARVRRRVLEAVSRAIPFLSKNLLALDSPHDGLDLEDHARDLVTRVPARWDGQPEPMSSMLRRWPDAFAGVCGLPLRGPIDNLWFVNQAVVPGFGEEGALLAALSAVREVTRSDPSKLRLRREVWRKAP